MTVTVTSRREFLSRAGGVFAAIALGAEAATAQGTPASSESMPGMNGQVRPVRLPAKPDAKPVVTPEERDALEHRLHCQCGTCTLDVYTCRTTDFTCAVSPAMHRDVLALVEGGHSAQEIIDAFAATYGERVLMAPKRSNILAWFTPGVAVLVGGGAIAMLLRRWKAEKQSHALAGPLHDVDATSDELARLDAAVRGDDRP